jgi:hypothetical protein
MVSRVPSLALPDLHPVLRLACPARPLARIQEPSQQVLVKLVPDGMGARLDGGQGGQEFRRSRMVTAWLA